MTERKLHKLARIVTFEWKTEEKLGLEFSKFGYQKVFNKS